jgi:hypothetical protein
MAAVARYYSTMKKAREATDALKEAGFGSDSIVLLSMPSKEPEGESASARTKSIAAAALKAGQLLGDSADFYSSKLKPGNSLVVVKPMFGRAVEAEAILARFQPMKIQMPKPPQKAVDKSLPWSQQAAPLSNALGWSVLSNNPTPFSDNWGFPVLARESLSFLSRWFQPLAPGWSLSRLLGLSLLSDDPTPLSNTVGIPLTSRRSEPPWTHSFGMSLLSDDSTPLSRRFDIPVLSRREYFLYDR